MYSFSFIELNAGFGSLRIAAESVGGDCVFCAEKRRLFQLAYNTLFKERPTFSQIYSVFPPGDFTQIPPVYVPKHDMILAKIDLKMYRSIDTISTKGTDLYSIIQIATVHTPKVIIIETGRKFIETKNFTLLSAFKNELEELGYTVYAENINAVHWLPQDRIRSYCVAIHNSIEKHDQFIFPTGAKTPKKFPFVLDNKVHPCYTIGQKTWEDLLKNRNKHLTDGDGIVSPPFEDKITRYFQKRYHKDGAEILISQGIGQLPRRLTPWEASKLMGIPSMYYRHFAPRFTVSRRTFRDRESYQFIADAVVIPIIKDILLNVLKLLN